MDRITALVLTIFIFIIFGLLAYYCAHISVWSSIVLSSFISLILLNIFYPINKVTDEPSDASLIVYAIFIILFVLIIGIYVFCNTLFDTREPNPPGYKYFGL